MTSKAAREFAADKIAPLFDPDELDHFAAPLVEMLEKVQYDGADWKSSCPACRGLEYPHRPGDHRLPKEPDGHEPDCALARLLEDHGKEVRWRK